SVEDGETRCQSLILLLELNLLKVSGIDVLTRLKADRRTRDTPVIALTMSNQDRDIGVGRQLGCEAHIVKPVGLKNFSQIVAYFNLEWTLIAANDRTGGAD